MFWHKVCCKVSCNPASQQAPDASIYPEASLSAQTFPWLERHLGMGSTHNAKKTGVLCQLSVQPFFPLSSLSAFLREVTRLHISYCLSAMAQ